MIKSSKYIEILMLNKTFHMTPAFKNSVYIFLSKASFVFASFVMSVMVARKLGLVEFGIYSLALSLYAMFELLSSSGLDNVVIREVAQDNSKTGLFFLMELFSAPLYP